MEDANYKTIRRTHSSPVTIGMSNTETAASSRLKRGKICLSDRSNSVEYFALPRNEFSGLWYNVFSGSFRLPAHPRFENYLSR